MKPHRILKSFPGSQTGHDHHHFEKGTVAHLSDSLAEIVVKEGWAKAVEDPADEPEAKSEGDAPANKMKKAAPENKAK